MLWKNEDLLIAGNKADNSLDIYKIKDNGALIKIDAIVDSDSTFLDEIVTINVVNKMLGQWYVGSH